jgi:hypothetical protein
VCGGSGSCVGASGACAGPDVTPRRRKHSGVHTARVYSLSSAAQSVSRSPAADARCARVVASRPHRDTPGLSSMRACVRRPESSLRLPRVAHDGSGKIACTCARARALRVHCARPRGTVLASGGKHLTGHVHTAARRATGLLR